MWKRNLVLRGKVSCPDGRNAVKLFFSAVGNIFLMYLSIPSKQVLLHFFKKKFLTVYSKFSNI